MAEDVKKRRVVREHRARNASLFQPEGVENRALANKQNLDADVVGQEGAVAKIFNGVYFMTMDWALSIFVFLFSVVFYCAYVYDAVFLKVSLMKKTSSNVSSFDPTTADLFL